VKILVQLEIEYEDLKNKNDFINLIKIIKNYYENEHLIPVANLHQEFNFKSLDKVRISRVIQ